MTEDNPEALARRVRELEALVGEQTALRDGIVRERVGRLAAERGLSAEQATDVHRRVMDAARLKAVLPYRDLRVVDALFEQVEADPTAAHLFQRMGKDAGTVGERITAEQAGKLSPAEYRRARREGRIR